MLTEHDRLVNQNFLRVEKCLTFLKRSGYTSWLEAEAAYSSNNLFREKEERGCGCIKDRPTVEYIIVELKKPKLQDGKNQLRSYCNATGAPSIFL